MGKTANKTKLVNMTVTAEEEVLRWARVKAAEANTSVARLVGSILKDRMRTDRGYQSAKRRFLAVQPRLLSDAAYPSREGIHDRSRFR